MWHSKKALDLSSLCLQIIFCLRFHNCEGNNNDGLSQNAIIIPSDQHMQQSVNDGDPIGLVKLFISLL